MAHLIDELVPRLCLLSDGRQSRNHPAMDLKYLRCVRTERDLARRKLDLSHLGCNSWRGICNCHDNASGAHSDCEPSTIWSRALTRARFCPLDNHVPRCDSELDLLS